MLCHRPTWGVKYCLLLVLTDIKAGAAPTGTPQHAPEDSPGLVWVQLFRQRHRIGLSLLHDSLHACAGIPSGCCCCRVEEHLLLGGVCLACCQLLLGQHRQPVCCCCSAVVHSVVCRAAAVAVNAQHHAACVGLKGALLMRCCAFSFATGADHLRQHNGELDGKNRPHAATGECIACDVLAPDSAQGLGSRIELLLLIWQHPWTCAPSAVLTRLTAPADRVGSFNSTQPARPSSIRTARSSNSTTPRQLSK